MNIWFKSLSLYVHEAANCYIQFEMASKASSSPCSEIFMFYSVQHNAIFTPPRQILWSVFFYNF